MTPSREAGLSRRPQQERSQQTVRRILAATLDLLAREGIESLTTNRIAAEAGLSVASLYRFFPNKQAVIYAAYGEWIEELSAEVTSVAAQWRARLSVAPGRWLETAMAIAGVLGESRRGARAEYELLRAMFSHRELRARDEAHTRALAQVVAGLMRCAGACMPVERIEALAAFANEQFTLAAELAGCRPDADRAAFAALARAAYVALWRIAIEGEAGPSHEHDNCDIDEERK